jgi:hypothetical protein
MSLSLPKSWRVSFLLEFEVFHYPWITFLVTPLRLAKLDAELNALKAMVDNAMSYFYPSKSSFAIRTPQMLDGLLNQSQENILANMR